MADQNTQDNSPIPIDISIGLLTTNRRLFSELITALDKLELKKKLDFQIESKLAHCTSTSQKQATLVNQYLDKIAKDKATIQKERHFKALDISLKETEFPKTRLPNNEGSAFLILSKNLLHITLLKKIIEIISMEKDKAKKDLLEAYTNEDDENMLHCLAACIAKKYGHSLLVTDNDVEVFDYFAELVPELKQQKNKAGFTPVEVIENAKQRSLFKKFVVELYNLECTRNEQEQIQLLQQYLASTKIDHFRRLDLALKDYAINTLLPNNEGCALLEIARKCSNIIVLEACIKAINTEKMRGRTATNTEEIQNKVNLLREYIDIDRDNILHCFVRLVVRKHKEGYTIIKKDWEAFNYFNELFSKHKFRSELELTARENDWEQTPAEISEEDIGLSPNTEAFYVNFRIR